MTTVESFHSLLDIDNYLYSVSLIQYKIPQETLFKACRILMLAIIVDFATLIGDRMHFLSQCFLFFSLQGSVYSNDENKEEERENDDH